MPEDKFQAFLNSTPPISVTAHWHERKKEIVMQGLEAPGLGATFRLYDGYLDKMEKALATRTWLAGETFSLADIAVTPYVNRLDMLGMTPMWERERPRVTQWFNRIKAPGSVQACLPGLVPPGPDGRPSDIWAAELAERRTNAGTSGLMSPFGTKRTC